MRGSTLRRFAPAGNAPILAPGRIEQPEEQAAFAFGFFMAFPFGFALDLAGVLRAARAGRSGEGSTTMSRAAAMIKRLSRRLRRPQNPLHLAVDRPRHALDHAVPGEPDLREQLQNDGDKPCATAFDGRIPVHHGHYRT